MAITVNRTLPNVWDATKTYHYGDTVMYCNIIYKCLQTSFNNPPDTSEDYWKALDIYIKDESVMDCDPYSGDQEFWERDRVYIDVNGYLYLNNENTGINVKGQDGKTEISFDKLTPEQLEQIRGPRGYIGPQGIQGETGPQGPMGEVVLTPEQIAALKGDDGKSAYQSWLDQGYSGTEADFVAWLRSGIIKLDPEPSLVSANGVENRAITQAFNTYKVQTTAIVNQLKARVEDLENRLKYKYNNVDYYFRFGITTEGKYGYFYNNENIIIPFDSVDSKALISSQAEVNSNAFTFQLGESAMTSVDGVGVHDPILYSGSPQIARFEDFFDTYVYIYKNGELYNANFDIGINGMNYDYSQPTLSTNMTSKGLAAGEGVIFSTLNVSETASVIRFKVHPLTSGTTINYQIGVFTDERATLPELVTAGTYRTEYENGSFNSEVTIKRNVRPGEGVYFATTAPGLYKITEIYLD